MDTYKEKHRNHMDQKDLHNILIILNFSANYGRLEMTYFVEIPSGHSVAKFTNI